MSKQFRDYTNVNDSVKENYMEARKKQTVLHYQNMVSEFNKRPKILCNFWDVMEKLNSFGTTPINLFASAWFSSMSTSNIFTWPEVLETSEQRILMKVDLPAPLAPSNAKKSPFLTVRFKLSRAFTPLS